MTDERDNMKTTSSIYNRAYFRDETQCFLPSCKKYRRDNPRLTFLRIPNALKETWCRAVERNCPQRLLYVCEEHFDLRKDCFKTGTGKLRLKTTANLILTRTYYENTKTEDIEETAETMNTLPTTNTDFNDVPNQMFDAANQCLVISHKGVLAKPSVRSIGCTANIKVASVATKAMPTKPHLLSSTTTSACSTPSLFEIPSSPTFSTSSNKENLTEKDLSGRNYLLSTIKENPKMYIGVPHHYYWFVDFLAEKCKLPLLHVIITLYKIKLNDTIKRISDQFNLSQVSIVELLKVCMSRLATYLQDFIYLPEPIQIKKTLPLSFKARYANVQCIIDCFEIEIEKPSDAVIQATTWSRYKSCNTVKYLIACCPNGFICFVSKGYGGRISDKAITENSGFVDILPPGAVVLADRGFKGIETLLRDRNVILLRPPSVSAKETPTKKDVLQGKVIASLRIHVERLIRRVREFRFLKPHSVINHSHLRYIDESVIIASGLINLQNEIIKMQ